MAQGYSSKHGSDSVRLLNYDRNEGKGFAVLQGVLHSRGEYILMVDADGASEISHMARLEKAMDRRDIGIAVGSRAELQAAAEAERSAFRNFLMHGFHMLVS